MGFWCNGDWQWKVLEGSGSKHARYLENILTIQDIFGNQVPREWEEDKVIWRLKKDGIYSVKSCYVELASHRELDEIE